MTNLEARQLIAVAAMHCESAAFAEVEAAANGRLLHAAEWAEEAEGYSMIAFNAARFVEVIPTGDHWS